MLFQPLVVLLLLVTLGYAQDNMTNGTGFDSVIATRARMDKFFCLERIEFDNGTVSYTQFEQNGSYVWTLMFQMPLLGFLDVGRKRALIDNIVAILNRNRPGSISGLDDVCLGTYETYGLTTFSESILIHIYSDSMMPYNVQQFHTAFMTGINDAISDPSSVMYRVVQYGDQSGIIALNLTASSQFRDTIQPSYDSSDNLAPINLAVFIGSWPYNMSFAGPVQGVSRQLVLNDAHRSRFAYNPNPINYGLEPGDIVFAVIGAILLSIVIFLIVFGYVIHPFFFA